MNKINLMELSILDAIIPLISLIVLEVILGIDNVIFISILADKLPVEKRDKLRYWGLGLAMIMRLILLFLVSWIMRLNNELFTIMDKPITGKDLILFFGGLFLIYKSVKEIHHKTEAMNESNPTKISTFKDALIQVILLDMVFSIDSIITAVGMTDVLWVMYAAVIVSVVIMLFASKPIMNFINQHPSFKILALCFLVVIGVALMAEGAGYKIPKAFIYSSLTFAFIVDLIQMKTSSSKQ